MDLDIFLLDLDIFLLDLFLFLLDLFLFLLDLFLLDGPNSVVPLGCCSPNFNSGLVFLYLALLTFLRLTILPCLFFMNAFLVKPPLVFIALPWNTSALDPTFLIFLIIII